MFKYRAHIPCIVEHRGPPPDIIEFKATSELVEYLKPYVDSNISEDAHLCISDDSVMLVSNHGFFWWVLGFVDKPEGLELPVWGGGKYFVKVDDICTAFSGVDVRSICGDEVTLKDGRVVRQMPTSKIYDYDKFGVGYWREPVEFNDYIKGLENKHED